MSTIEMKAIASSFYEAYNRKDIEQTFSDFIAADLVNHTLGGSPGRQQWLDFDNAFTSACPDLKLIIKDQLAEENKVVTYWACFGTHTSTFMGMAPSGNPIVLEGISIDRLENGKIKEHIAIADFTQFMQQFAKIK